MPAVFLPDLRLNAEISGPTDGPALVLIHALGTDLHLWDDLIPLLPPTLRTLRFDLRGHGASDVPHAPYAMGTLIRDTERLMDHFAVKDAVVLGVSLGGLIAQGLAVKRLDLVRGLVRRARLTDMNPEGWCGCAAAIAGTDFYQTTATLRLPTLVFAGANDAATPPDLVRETAELIPGHRFQLLRRAGHLPMVEKPAEYAAVLTAFLDSIGHA
ncbi:MAG: 3-oxoadipate enol-lactonase [Rhodobacteraceae bacterium PARR1]|nr:MAG: 3-oxoadipate enol-lactonase [Rhodobacteraceae bacterium PARR1]